VQADTFRVEHPPREAGPLGYGLNLIEEEKRPVRARVRRHAVKGLEYRAQQIRSGGSKAVVFKVEVQDPPTVDAAAYEAVHFLETGEGLANAPHPDEHARLTRRGGQHQIAGCIARNRACLRVSDQVFYGKHVLYGRTLCSNRVVMSRTRMPVRSGSPSLPVAAGDQNLRRRREGLDLLATWDLWISTNRKAGRQAW